ncbi:MAG: ROK family protein [Phycisphaeraceae bacterium]|nr:ROK family protein [Phycisphaeraceae bacterium]
MASLGVDIGGTSVKVAFLDGDRISTARSAEYSRPGADELCDAIALALPPGSRGAAKIGLCVPGRLDPSRSCVVQSINLPGIENLPLSDLVTRSTGGVVTPLIVSDAYAAAHDYWSSQKPLGRLLAISIGTGVGASVLDDGRPLLVSGETPGHFGQIDVTFEGSSAPRTLESYVGANAIRAEYGDGFADAVGKFDKKARPLLALARGIRIAHAIYRPDTVALLGYVGMLFQGCREELESAIRSGLTSVAKADWKLSFGTSPFHAAIGAARLASLSQAARGVGDSSSG